MSLFCELMSLGNESDVEQKFIYPLLTTPFPLGLAFNNIEIFTKKVLRQEKINKGDSQKYYYPDYLIMIRGIPVLVVEAKNPGDNLSIAYSEARLYAQEINAKFPHNTNVCQHVIVCNGTETWAGYSDDAEPVHRLTFDDFNIENVKFGDLLNFCSRKKLEEIANKPYVDARGKAVFKSPVSRLGGKRVQNEELVENSFGRTLVFENRQIFDPETEQERINIVENAYVDSAKREQHIEPIYKEIRKFELPSQKNSTSLATDNPVELVDKLSQRIDGKIDAYSIILLIGNVGSGKTTFIRYFKQMFLQKKHKDLAEKCEWVFLNMIPAPGNRQEIYDWIKDAIVSQIKSTHNDIDFDAIDNIKKLFRREIRRFETGIGKLLESDKQAYDKELYGVLSNCLNDKGQYLEALFCYLKDFTTSLPILVLDNCDKRDKDEQLLMFQVAQWLRTAYKCIVILPMRDSTYDTYRDEPPLDTVVKDLVFRIDPPDLLKVLQKRLEYIYRLASQKDQTYALENGMQVSIKREEPLEYFRCLMLAIRKSDQISNILYRLSDRNIRNGIEIFENFCKSGHISSDEIFKIRAVGEEYDISSYMFINALLRKNRRYYRDEESNIVNLFYSSFDDDFPDPFARVDILLWLSLRIGQEGPNNAKGLFPVSNLLRDMQVLGHDLTMTLREVNCLIKRGLIFSEGMPSNVESTDLVKISISGSLHLRLLSNVPYLAACAEDVIYKYTETMTNISRIISNNYYLSKLSMVSTANEMISYLRQYRSEIVSHPEICLEDGTYMNIYDLEECQSAIDKWISSDADIRRIFPYILRFPSNSHVMVRVVYKGNGNLICFFTEATELKGFLTISDPKYCLSYELYQSTNVNDILSCEVVYFDYSYRSFQLRVLKKENDT